MKEEFINNREAYLYLVCGEKSSGKTNELIENLIPAYIKGNAALKIPPRKVLVMDINNEYPYKKIASDKRTIQMFMAQPTIEPRRIVPYKQTEQGAQKKSGAEIVEDMKIATATFMNGLLVLEDLSKIVGDTMTMDLYGDLCTLRHVDTDVIINFQSVGKCGNPKFRSVTNIIRMHHVQDSAKYHKDKFQEAYPMIRIAQFLVNNVYESCECEGDKCQCGARYYFVYINFIKKKITGDFDHRDFDLALDQYINENKSDTINPLIDELDSETGKKKYTVPQSFIIAKHNLTKAYYGNPK